MISSAGILQQFVCIALILISTAGTVLGQKNYTNEEKLTVARNVDSLLISYMKTSTFTKGGENKYNELIGSQLMSLFTEDALIFDDVVPNFKDDGNGSPYKLEIKKKKDFFRSAYAELPTGIRIKNRMIRISFDDLDKGNVKVYLNRLLETVTKTGGYWVANNDTLLLSLVVQKNLSVKISGITPIGVSGFRVQNDSDQDGLIDALDECKTQKGLWTLNGCPDKDHDGIPDKDDNCPIDSGEAKFNGCPDGWYSYPLVLSASAGYIMALNRIETPEASSLSRPFNALDSSQSMNGAKITNPGFTGGIAFNAHIAYYFGKKSSNMKKGVSLGISIYSYEADYSMNNAVIHFKDFDGIDFYRRILTIHEANEKVRFNTVNIPLMFRYRFKPTKKLGMEFSAGASYMLFFNRFSNDKVTYDAEGAYAYKGGTGVSQFDYFQVFDPVKNDYLMLRAEDINPDDFGFNGSAAAAYNLLSGADRRYDFGLNRELSDNGDFAGIETRYGYALNGGLDFTYNIFYKVLFKAGASVIVGRNNSKVSDKEYTFITTDKETGEATYNSIFDSNKASTYIAFGVNVGIIVGLFNN